MTLRIETLENSEKNRTTKEDEKAEEAEQPMIMAPQLMLANCNSEPQKVTCVPGGAPSMSKTISRS
jgi:hypothetical protein